MNVGEIIIKAKMSIKEFIDDSKELIDKAKDVGEKAGEKLSQAFNKAVNIGKGLLGVVGKIGSGFLRLITSAGLVSAILGSAGIGAMSLAGALKKVFEENEQIKANIQYIVFALSKALEPVINEIANIIVKIINLLFQAVQYTALLIQAWTGKNIFAGATMDAFAENMANANKDSKGVAKNLKDAKKQLAGFDEMNVLSDTSSSGGGASGGSGGGVMPSFDLSTIEGKPPKWMVWIKDNWKIVTYGIGAIATALLLLKLGLTLPEALLGGLITAQVVSILIGVANQIINIINFLKDPSWENFFELIKGFLGTQGLVGILIEETVIKALGGWDEIEKKLKPVAEWIMNNVIQPVIDYFTDCYDSIVKIFEPIVGFFKELFDTTLSNAEIIFDNVVAVFQWAWDELVKIFSPVAEWFGEKFDKAYKMVKEVFSPVAEWFGDVFDKAYKRIKERFSPVINFMTDMWNKIKGKLSDIGTRAGEIVGDAFKLVINGILRMIENQLNAPIRAINLLIDKIGNVVPGLSRLNTFSLPRLAKGGIVNMPGRGVMVGGAMTGESGAEGVIPLTDSQQMMLLGEAIGKYITVNANIVTTLNGRVISRELKKAQNEDDFAFNR